MPETKRIGDLMVARGMLDRAGAESVAADRLCGDERYASTAVRTGKVQEHDALVALAAQAGWPAVDLAAAVIPKAVIDRVPHEIARRHLILPLREDGSTLLLAMVNPQDEQVSDEVGFATGLRVVPHVALHGRVRELIPQAYQASGAFRGPRAPESGGHHVPVVEDAKPLPPVPKGVDIEVVVGDEPLDLEPSAKRAAPRAAGKKLILVVEDEADIQKLVMTSLGSLGDVIAASRGLEALELIKARKPDLIVLDAMLPEVHGFEICRKVKESKRFGHTPVLMISAIYRGWRIAADIKATYKVDEFLEKPFRVADLRRRAQQLLERQATPVGTDEELGAVARAHVEAAEKAFGQGDAATAFRELRAAEGLEPFSAKIQYFLAQVLEKGDRPLQAIYHYERAVELEPGFFAAARSLAVLYQSRGFKNKAVEMWERALSAAPTAELREQIKQYVVTLL